MSDVAEASGVEARHRGWRGAPPQERAGAAVGADWQALRYRFQKGRSQHWTRAVSRSAHRELHSIGVRDAGYLRRSESATIEMPR